MQDVVNVLSSDSSGNCEIYCRTIAVDMGIPFIKIMPYIRDLQIVLLSHSHSDHLNISTIRQLAAQRPTLRFAVGEHLVDKMEGIRNVDVCEVGSWYDYQYFKISPVMLYHDVPNIGWRIFVKMTNNEFYKIFRATDTAHLNGITAKDYDLYAIESNYNEETVFEEIAAKKANGEFSHKEGTINSHLSEQQASDFIFKNANANSYYIRLHEPRLIR